MPHFDYDCTICKDCYDDDDKRPLIGSCGHTICMECVENLRSPNRGVTTRCPICNSSHAFKTKVVNFELVEFMKKKAENEQQPEGGSAKVGKNEVPESTTDMICNSCSMNTNESRMAVCETCGVGSKVLQRESDGRIIVANPLKLKKFVICGCCLLEKHQHHQTISLITVELDTLSKEFRDNCSANIELKQSNNTAYWMQSAIDVIADNLRKMSNVDDARLVSDAMKKLVQYTKPISKIITACEEEYERRIKMSGLWLDVMSKFLTAESCSSYSGDWKLLRATLVEVIDGLEEDAEAVGSAKGESILNLILHEKNNPLPKPPVGDSSHSHYGYY